MSKMKENLEKQHTKRWFRIYNTVVAWTMLIVVVAFIGMTTIATVANAWTWWFGK